jgi:biopolymer transport protein ExbD
MSLALNEKKEDETIKMEEKDLLIKRTSENTFTFVRGDRKEFTVAGKDFDSVIFNFRKNNLKAEYFLRIPDTVPFEKIKNLMESLNKAGIFKFKLITDVKQAH